MCENKCAEGAREHGSKKKEVNMRQHNAIKFIILLLVLLIGGLHVQADDKELFMGTGGSTMIAKPNVVVLMDNSGSMNSIVSYPQWGVDGIKYTADDGYFPAVDYIGSVEDSFSNLSSPMWFARWVREVNGVKHAYNYRTHSPFDGWGGNSYWTGCYEVDAVNPNKFRAGGNSTRFYVGDYVLYQNIDLDSDGVPSNDPENDVVAYAKIKSKDGNWLELEDIQGGTITASADNNKAYFTKVPPDSGFHLSWVRLYGDLDNVNGNTHNNSTRYTYNYRQWMFIHATDDHRKALTHFSYFGTFDVNINPPPMEPNLFGNDAWEAWWRSDCQNPGQDRFRYRFTRIQVAREVICRVATMSNETVNLGLFRFNHHEGGDELDSITPSNDLASDLVAYKNMVNDLEADTWTPLAEALADVWKYYKPGPSGSKDYWPTDSYSSVHAIEYWCQKNYVIVMTDGESTEDRFDEDFGDSIFTSASSPVQRTQEYTTWSDWQISHGWGDMDTHEADNGIPSGNNSTATYCPNQTCWYTSSGSDYLDDVAYFMSHQDLFPDNLFQTDGVTDWPGDQNVMTYTIGFNIDNDMLMETAMNGDGAYFNADDYDSLVNAFEQVITGILLRNFAFSAITAPKKTATTTDSELTVSYVGYFLPSGGNSIWEGHLLAYELQDLWGFDADGLDGITFDEYSYPDEESCVTANSGAPCERWLELNAASKWDAATRLPDTRSIYTHTGSTLIPFNTDNQATLKPMIIMDRWGFDADTSGDVTADEYVYDSEDDCTAAAAGSTCYSWLETGCDTCDNDMDMIVAKVNQRKFGDVFHSDVGFVGPPPIGKKYVKNINPIDPDGQTFEEFYNTQKDRRNALFVGTNDGILHLLYADDKVHADERDAGKEVWGFIPDEILTVFPDIYLDNHHNYTVDGRMAAEDIYYSKTVNADPTWSTILTFGMRRGGHHYYTMDITDFPESATSANTEPELLWQYKHDTYSGQSWGKAAFGKVLLKDSSGNPMEKWVAVLAGGFAFNEENDDDLQGKAVFVVDASNGDLLWMIGYDPDGDDDTTDIEVLTSDDRYNFPVPSAVSLIDKNNDGYVDTVYFGNLGGHLFRIDISADDVDDWESINLYEAAITTLEDEGIDTVGTPDDAGEVEIKLDGNSPFVAGDRVRGLISNAQGYIKTADHRDLIVKVDAGTFQANETLAKRSYQPIYLSPAVAYNTCFQLWIAFGTGDRDRPRTDPEKGRFIAIRDDFSVTGLTLANLDDLSALWTDDELPKTSLSDTKNGWYFDFPDAGEKIFDPEPLIIPDENMVPHLLFNTYQPPEEFQNSNKVDDPCNQPNEGRMTLYDVSMYGCSPMDDAIQAEKTTGRIAGGGIYQGQEYVLYTSETGKVADAPGEDGHNFKTKGNRLPYPGGVVFFKEKKR